MMGQGGVNGLGVDIVEIERMEAVLERSPSFKDRVFSQNEREYCESKARPAVHYASRFAAKEAVLKALGTGFGGVGIRDVEVVNNAAGKPEVVLHGSARRIAEEQGVIEIPLSLSNTHQVCVANAVALTRQRMPEVEPRIDPRAALEKAFKEARALLDEMDGRPASPDDADGDAGGGSDGRPSAGMMLGIEDDHDQVGDADGTF